MSSQCQFLANVFSGIGESKHSLKLIGADVKDLKGGHINYAKNKPRLTNLCSQAKSQ